MMMVKTKARFSLLWNASGSILVWKELIFVAFVTFLQLTSSLIPGVSVCPKKEAVGRGRYNWEKREHYDDQQPKLLSLMPLVSSTRPVESKIILMWFVSTVQHHKTSGSRDFRCSLVRNSLLLLCTLSWGKSLTSHRKVKNPPKIGKTQLKAVKWGFAPVISQEMDDSNDCRGPVEKK